MATSGAHHAEPEARRLAVADAVWLHTLVWPGAPRRRPYVLLHGLASNCRTWEGVARRLQEHGHPVAAVDLRGHGLSDQPEDGYDFATMTTDVLAAITALGLEAPVVAGQSTGGNLAVELAHRAPEAIAGAVGVDGGSLELQRRWPDWAECQRSLAPPRLEGMAAEEFEATLRRHHPDWSDAGVAATLANIEILPDRTIRPRLSYERHLRILRALWEHKPSALLPELRVPLLLVLASSDGDQMQAEAAGSHIRVERMEGDHDLHVQHPVALADLFERCFPS